MHLVNNGFVASNFMEESKTFKGSKKKTTRLKTKATVDREKSAEMILAASKKPGQSLDKILTQIIKRNENGLRNYIIAKGEIPDANPLVMATQAALIRADEVATIATAVDTDDTDALQAVESAEQEAKDINSPDALQLPVEAQAALSLLLDYAKDRNRKRGGSGNLGEVVNKLRRVNVAKKQGVRISSAFTGTPDNLTGFDFSQWTNAPTDTGTTVVGTTQPSGTGLTNTIGTIFGIFDKVLDGINKAGDTIQTAGGKVSGAIGGVQTQINTSASTAASEALKKNLPYILIGGIVFIVLIFIAVKYGNKR